VDLITKPSGVKDACFYAKFHSFRAIAATDKQSPLPLASSMMIDSKIGYRPLKRLIPSATVRVRRYAAGALAIRFSRLCSSLWLGD